MKKPLLINLVNNELCIAWEDGVESYLSGAFLRKHSPSAENVGEKDILGNHYGPEGKREHAGVSLLDFEYVGNYAVRLIFSDGHKTGIYSWAYLREIGDELIN